MLSLYILSLWIHHGCGLKLSSLRSVAHWCRWCRFGIRGSWVILMTLPGQRGNCHRLAALSWENHHPQEDQPILWETSGNNVPSRLKAPIYSRETVRTYRVAYYLATHIVAEHFHSHFQMESSVSFWDYIPSYNRRYEYPTFFLREIFRS